MRFSVAVGVQLTRVFVLELGYIIDVFVNNHPWAVALAMRRDIVFGKGLGHVGQREFGSEKFRTKEYSG